jgi:hypothetical protein
MPYLPPIMAESMLAGSGPMVCVTGSLWRLQGSTAQAGSGRALTGALAGFMPPTLCAGFLVLQTVVWPPLTWHLDLLCLDQLM